MALSITQPRKGQSPVLAVAIAIFGIIAGFIYYSQIFSQTGAIVQPVPISTADNLSKFKDFTFDIKVLDDPRFKSLKIFGESPVQAGQTGKTDVFSP